MHRHTDSTLQTLEKFMSKFVDDATALIETIATGGADDQATKDAVTALQEHMATVDAEEADTQAVVTKLLEKLAASAPAPEKAAGEGEGTAA